MSEMISYLEAFIPLMLRVILGLLFLFQSYDILFRIGFKETYQTVCEGCRKRSIPDWFTKFSVISSTYIQFLGGILMILGLFTPITIIILGINLIMVSFAFGFLNGLWDLKHVFPRVVLLTTIALLYEQYDIWALDRVFNLI